MRHATPFTQSRCERLLDRTASGSAALVLSLALLHPAALVVGVLLLLAAAVDGRTRRNA